MSSTILRGTPEVDSSDIPAQPSIRPQLYECLNCGERRTIKNRGECVKCRACDYRVLLKVQSKPCVTVLAR